MHLDTEHIPAPKETPAVGLQREITSSLESILDLFTLTRHGSEHEQKIQALYLRHQKALQELTERARRCENQNSTQ